MRTLTQYGLDGREHWREHRPRMGEMERTGTLQQMCWRPSGRPRTKMDRIRAAADPAGTDTAAGPRPGLGNGQGEVHPPGRRERLGPPRNQANYRITDRDRVGEGHSNRSSAPTSRRSSSCAALNPTNGLPLKTKGRSSCGTSVGAGCRRSSMSTRASGFKEQVELSKLLTDEEHTSARASTLNAHYTSPVICSRNVRCPRAFSVSRMGGFLEPACGWATSSG